MNHNSSIIKLNVSVSLYHLLELGIRVEEGRVNEPGTEAVDPHALLLQDLALPEGLGQGHHAALGNVVAGGLEVLAG